MTARRSAPDADVVGIEAVFLGVGAQPADGCLAVLDLGGEDGVLAEAVVDARRRVALGDQRDRRAAVLAAAIPAASVNPDDDGQGMVRLGGQVEVELVAGVSPGDIFQIAVDLHAWGQGWLGRRCCGFLLGGSAA